MFSQSIPGTRVRMIDCAQSNQGALNIVKSSPRCMDDRPTDIRTRCRHEQLPGCRTCLEARTIVAYQLKEPYRTSSSETWRVYAWWWPSSIPAYVHGRFIEQILQRAVRSSKLCSLDEPKKEKSSVVIAGDSGYHERIIHIRDMPCGLDGKAIATFYSMPWQTPKATVTRLKSRSQGWPIIIAGFLSYV
jgi:hypothetical protein